MIEGFKEGVRLFFFLIGFMFALGLFLFVIPALGLGGFALWVSSFPPACANPPKVGCVEGGYVYNGGDPARQISWTKQ